MRQLAIATLLFASSVPAQSQSDIGRDLSEGNGLYADCVSDTVGKIGCYAYIMGVADSLNGYMFCPPAGTRRQQVFEVVTAGLTAHPEERQKPSVVLANNGSGRQRIAAA